MLHQISSTRRALPDSDVDFSFFSTFLSPNANIDGQVADKKDAGIRPQCSTTWRVDTTLYSERRLVHLQYINTPRSSPMLTRKPIQTRFDKWGRCTNAALDAALAHASFDSFPKVRFLQGRLWDPHLLI